MGCMIEILCLLAGGVLGILIHKWSGGNKPDPDTVARQNSWRKDEDQDQCDNLEW